MYYGPGSGSSSEAQRLRQMAWSGFGNSAAAGREYEAMANDYDADRARAAYYRNYQDNLAHQNYMRNLASQDQDLADRSFQRNLLGAEQSRKNFDTQQRYRFLNRQSNNQLAAQREMTRGMQNLFGGGLGGKGGLLDGLLGFGRQEPPTTTMFGADGSKIGGTGYSRNYGGVRGGSLLAGLRGEGMRLR